MASSGQASSSLGDDDLGTLHRALYPARNSYKSLGLQIGVKIGEIKSIESESTDNGERLLGVLSVRLKKAEPLTWNDTDSALRLDCVGEGKTADGIRQKYGHLFSPDPSSVAQTHQETKEEKMKKKRRKKGKGRPIYLERSDRDSGGEVGGRAGGKKSTSQSSEESSSSNSEEEVVVKQKKVRKKAKGPSESVGVMPRKKRGTKSKIERHIKVASEESDREYERELPKSNKAKKKIKAKKKSARDEISSDDLDYQYTSQRSKRSKRKPQVFESDNDSSATSSEEEILSHTDTRRKQGKAKPSAKYAEQSKSIQSKEWQAKQGGKEQVPPKGRDRAHLDREVGKMSHRKQKEVKSESESEEDSASTSDEGESSEPKQKTISTPLPSGEVAEERVIKRKTTGGKGMKRVLEHAEEYEVSEDTNRSKHQNEGKRKKNDRVKKGEVKEARKVTSSSSSETDDSSPECDVGRIVSESENKKLVKVFKCNYGKLCYAIKDPNATAVQLQAKRLLSRSKLKNVLISPESQQVKAIAIVHALYQKIKSCPEKLFTISEVCLHNESLQEVGTEMSIEIGKVCPDRPASVFSPPEILPTAESDTGETPAKKMHQPLPIASFSEASSISSSVKVSISIPQLGPSPVLTKYKKYLKACYDAKPLAPSDKYLPTLDAPYINLAMVGRESYNPEQRDEFTRQTLHGGVDQIVQSKTPISIEHLLTPKEGGRPIRFILVEGPPGIGKSTFAWEACRRWDEIESLRDYHTVVLLRLREKWVLNATSLSDLLRYPSHPDFSESIASELVQSQGRNVLLVLDGFDEVSHSFHENSVIKSVLCRQLLPECTIILTTRPSAKYTLESVCQPRIDKHVEIIGFTEEERVRYITEVFSKEPELQVNFLKYMFLVPHIKSMMYIPLNCAIIARVYYESQTSRQLAIPRTRTQLYKALTHSLLVRHMKMKKTDYEATSNLPEGLNKEDMNAFKTLAKFAFDSYHEGGSRKITFFKEHIPEGLIHFGFMNESTEMYAGKGVERTFSFLHLSLQEYLAAWHLAKSYSIEFQMAYHRLALDMYRQTSLLYEGDDKGEETLFLSLQKQWGSSLEEPAIFLAGITGWRCQSEDGRNPWEMYLSQDTADLIDIMYNTRVLFLSLYEAQNPTLLPHYFSPETLPITDELLIEDGLPSQRRVIDIDSGVTPYDCYALSYCVAHSSDRFAVDVAIKEDDISLVETFTKGLDDHSCETTSSKASHLYFKTGTVEGVLFWIMRSSFFSDVEMVYLYSTFFNYSLARTFIQSLVKLQLLHIFLDSETTWESLAALKSVFSKLKVLRLYSEEECNPPPSDLVWWPEEHKLTKIELDIKFSSDKVHDIRSPADVLVDSVLKSVLRSTRIITKIVLSNVSRETMAGVHSILLHCPSLTTLELKRTRLGYDGILYICSTLRNNTTLRHLAIRDDLQLPPSREEVKLGDITTFSSMEKVPLPGKTTCTDFLLELNDILKDNTTLGEVKIQSGLFLPLSADGEDEWTGLGPLQQFNVGAVRSGMSPNLRRSFSSSDLTQPQTQLFWDKQYISHEQNNGVNFNKLFSDRKEEGKKLFSFTAPDTAVLQSFSGLDPRLKECLEISQLHQYVETLKATYCGLLAEVDYVIHNSNN